MSKEAMKLALEAAYLAGWNASGEGYNAEYPFGDHARNPEEDDAWIKGRDNALREALAEQPAPKEAIPAIKDPLLLWKDCWIVDLTEHDMVVSYSHSSAWHNIRHVERCIAFSTRDAAKAHAAALIAYSKTLDAANHKEALV